MLPVGLSEAVLTEHEQIAQYIDNRDARRGATIAALRNRPGMPPPGVNGIYVINGSGDTVYEGLFRCGMRCGTRAPLG